MRDKKRVELQLPAEAVVTVGDEEDAVDVDSERPDSPEQDDIISAVRRLEDVWISVRWVLMIIAVAIIIFDSILGIALAFTIIDRSAGP